MLGDGRIIEYWDGGDPDGRAVILHPGTPSTRVLGHWPHEAADSAGVRLLTVNRPGYGGSTASTEPSLLRTGQETAALAAGLGLERYAVIGASGGGPFAVATAIADPTRVRAVGVVGGIGPWRLLEPPDKNPDTAAPNHSPRFYVDEACLGHGMKLLSGLAFDWLAANA